MNEITLPCIVCGGAHPAIHHTDYRPPHGFVSPAPCPEIERGTPAPTSSSKNATPLVTPYDALTSLPFVDSRKLHDRG